MPTPNITEAELKELLHACVIVKQGARKFLPLSVERRLTEALRLMRSLAKALRYDREHEEKLHGQP